jgi:hypothetical protein
MLAEHVRARRSRNPPLLPRTSDAFDSAWAAFPDVGRRRSSRSESWPQWSRVAREIGENELLAAVLAYSTDPKELKAECGSPGFHRWLKAGRWEHWLGSTNTQVPTEPILPKTFPDVSLRLAFHLRFKDERARRWFDRCGWEPESRTVTAPHQTVRKEWVDGALWPWLKEQGVGLWLE